MTNEIAEDIEKMVEFIFSEYAPNSLIFETAERVEAWLATYQPEKL